MYTSQLLDTENLKMVLRTRKVPEVFRETVYWTRTAHKQTRSSVLKEKDTRISIRIPIGFA